MEASNLASEMLKGTTCEGTLLGKEGQGTVTPVLDSCNPNHSGLVTVSNSGLVDHDDGPATGGATATRAAVLVVKRPTPPAMSSAARNRSPSAPRLSSKGAGPSHQRAISLVGTSAAAAVPQSGGAVPSSAATVSVVLLTTAADALEAEAVISQHKRIAVDCEGCSLSRSGRLCLVQVCWNGAACLQMRTNRLIETRIEARCRAISMPFDHGPAFKGRHQSA